jgi:hypothetical protein
MTTHAQSIVVDILLLFAVIISIFLTYNASIRLTQREAKRWWVVALRAVIIGEVIVLIYTIVDIPWTIGRLYYPELGQFQVLEYLFIYAIVTTMVVFPAINLLLRISLTKREIERQELMSEREDLLKQIQVATNKFLHKQMSEAVFLKVTTDLHARVVQVESRLEKLRIEAEQPGPLFSPRP